jgi:hypothetical protein
MMMVMVLVVLVTVVVMRIVGITTRKKLYGADEKGNTT